LILQAMHKLYNLSILLYSLAIQIISPFHAKARFWRDGRKNWEEKLRSWREKTPGELFWIHCSSLGEFEQGRPVIEALRIQRPEVKILLTFFSPSGYEIRKKYSGVDGVFYLPLDTPVNAQNFVDISRPSFVVIVKYEFWANYLLTLKNEGIQVISICTIFREGQRFFKSKRGFWTDVLFTFDHFFVQNKTSGELLEKIGLKNYTQVGDTRFDRVVEIADRVWANASIEQFSEHHKILVIGSSYLPEEKLGKELLVLYPNLKLIVAPHEVNGPRLAEIRSLFAGQTVSWSEGKVASLSRARVLLIDSIGSLSNIYRYADFVLIGGGFGKGIHNVLEAAVYGKALFFGRCWQKFDEARALLGVAAAFSGHDEQELLEKMKSTISSAEKTSDAGTQARKYVRGNLGATARIMEYIIARIDGN